MQDPTGKKADQGLIAVAKSKTTAAIVEVNCNSDFVAKTAEFQRIVKDAAETTLKTFTENTDKISLMGEEILRLKIPGKDDTLQEEVALAIGKLKENIVINRGCILNAPPGGFIASYIHPSVLVSATRPGFTLGSFAVIASMSCHDVESSATAVRLRGRDLCQHIVGMKPAVIGEKRVEVLNETKVKENSLDVNSVSGTVEEHEVRKYPPPNDRSDHLMRQPFLLDTDISVEHWLEMAGLEIHDFIRYQVGENVK
ncbi:unnamed protein product [Clavelina lepadiformis]|uniref:Elongation factor Ts, mitochondrial n=1 Tax=Clavelina lepadiformis TaxID=159417 RepID=A0ABP0F866_CLALP